MSKIKCKGTSLKQEISSVYTAVAQIISFDHSGSKALTFESTTLDGGVAKTYDSTGYAETPELSGELFYDPALSGHQSYTDLIETPAQTNFRITYADNASTTQTFATVGHGADVTVAMDDGLKMKFSMKVTGTSGWPT